VPIPYAGVIMQALVLLTIVAGGGQIETIAKTFGVDWSHLIAQIISFSIVCVLLRRFAYQRVLKMLQDRRQRIAQGLADSEKIKAELARADVQREEILRQANHQATQMIDEARTAAARVQQEEMQKAIAAAEGIIVKAREAAAQEHAAMIADLKREVGRLIVETSAKLTGKILTPDDQQRLAEETSKQLAARAIAA
jgi:F-type H+-transporting ATPase subunit b